jgi:hypothetical protein
MHTVVRNALVGATASCLLATVLMLFMSHQFRDALTIRPLAIHWATLTQLTTNYLYMWCPATLATVIYGALAQRLGIYGRGSDVPVKWKNALLCLSITIPIFAILTVGNLLVGAEVQFFVAIAFAMVISDAHAPSGASTAGS